MKKACPRIIIAGTSSNSGKTVISAGIAYILRKKGLKVRCFKAGPDFIDSQYLSIASDNHADNLDTWLMNASYIRQAVATAANDADIIIIEGVRSLYDGISALGEAGSTAHIAKILDAPVILTINARSIAKGAAAIALGFKSLDPDVDIQGIILNFLNGETHYKKVKQAIIRFTNLQVLGGISRFKGMDIEMRHLGLKTVVESDNVSDNIAHIASVISESLDVDALVDIARSAPPLDAEPFSYPAPLEDYTAHIGIAWDASFNFYYPENLASLQRAGAQISLVSPMYDKKLPDDLSGFYIGGGFPEFYLDILEGNTSFKKSARNNIEDGMPVVAECGGLIYMCKNMQNKEGKTFKMLGIFDADAMLCDKCQSISYTILHSVCNNTLTTKDTIIKGHEFHYSKVIPNATDSKFAFDVLRGKGILDKKDGWMEHNALGQFAHFHFGATPSAAIQFVRMSEMYSRT